MITEVGIITSELARSVAFWEVCLGVPSSPQIDIESLPGEVAHVFMEQSVTVSGSVVLPSAAAIGRVRLIEADAAHTRARSTERCPRGWRAVEVMVRDLDRTFAEASELASEVLGLPRWLGEDPAVGIRAGQLVGPAGEIVYLTELDRSVVTLELPEQREFGSVFILVVGTLDIDATVEHYARSAFPLIDRSSTLISSLNVLQNTPDRETPSALISAGSGSYFELNEYVGGELSGGSTPAAPGPIAYVRSTDPSAAPAESDDIPGSTTMHIQRVGPNSEVLLIDGHTPLNNCATSHSQ